MKHPHSIKFRCPRCQDEEAGTIEPSADLQIGKPYHCGACFAPVVFKAMLMPDEYAERFCRAIEALEV